MAASTATMKYASRSAVSGSSAYDLSRFREYSFGEPPRPRQASRTAQPLRTPQAGAARPALREVYAPDVKPAEKKAPKAAPRPAAKRARTKQKAYGLSLFAVAGFAFVAVLMVFLLLAHVRYNEITSETAALQVRLNQLTEEERKLRIAYEDAFDVNEVEEYATNVLGMTKPLDTQVATVAAAAADKAVVVDEPAEDDGGGLGTFLMSLVAYFK